MPAVTIANIVSENLDDQTISPFLVYSVKHDAGLIYLPPLYIFSTTEKQRQIRVAFCTHHIENHTNFDNVLFTDESSFELTASHKWLWQRRGEASPDVQCAAKSVQKELEFLEASPKIIVLLLLPLKVQSLLKVTLTNTLMAHGLYHQWTKFMAIFNWS